MKISLLFLLFILTYSVAAQTNKNPDPFARVDNKILAIPKDLANTTSGIAAFIKTNFESDSDKARAVFIWIANNIQYDIENIFAINFYESSEERIHKIMATRKGVCSGYADLFNEICQKSGIKSFVIIGYTKQNGFADYIPHAWNAAWINNKWSLFDATWGSGYISNHKFVKRINNAYYNANPTIFIRDHIPFDPLWEMLNYQVTNQEFYEGITQQNASKPYFNYTDSILVWEKQTKMEQWASAARRIEQNGLKNSMIFDHLYHIIRLIEIEEQTEKTNAHNETVNLYNSTLPDYNSGINFLNDFINYRNKQFKPLKTDAALQAMVDSASVHINAAKSKLRKITNPDSTLTGLIISANKSLDEVEVRLQEQQEFLDKYFKKNKLGRKTMFTKYTWMGIPLN